MHAETTCLFRHTLPGKPNVVCSYNDRCPTNAHLNSTPYSSAEQAPLPS